MKSLVVFLSQPHTGAFDMLMDEIKSQRAIEFAGIFIDGKNVSLANAFNHGVQSDVLADAALEHLNKAIALDNLELWATAWHGHYIEMAANQFAWDQSPSSNVHATYTRWKRDFHDEMQQAIQNAFDAIEVDVREYYALIAERNALSAKIDTLLEKNCQRIQQSHEDAEFVLAVCGSDHTDAQAQAALELRDMLPSQHMFIII